MEVKFLEKNSDWVSEPVSTYEVASNQISSGEYTDFPRHTGIEDKVFRQTEAIALLCELLVSKGIVSPEEFLSVLGIFKKLEIVLDETN